MTAVLAVAAFCGATLALHLASIALALRRPGAGNPRVFPVGLPPVSVLRPVCGIEDFAEETLASTFALTYPSFEMIFCVASAADPVAPLVERLIEAHPGVPARLLVGDDPISGNPKLNNLVKGWAAARHDWIVMSDSNLLLPPDYLQALLARWIPGTGLVSSPPIGIRPEGFWAELECAFLNTYQARWQLAADSLGLGFAQGKTLFWRRDVLEGGGGPAVLGAELAEDVASTKFVRRVGLKVRLTRRPFPQPLGRRTLAEVWRRQVRWARVRRAGFPGGFAAEIASGGAFPILGAIWLGASGALPAGGALAYGLVWYLAEGLLARLAGWPASPRGALACLLRDLLLPAVWFAGWAGRGFEWRGTPMAMTRAPAASRIGRD